MNRVARGAGVSLSRKLRAKRPMALTAVPKASWPSEPGARPIEVWQSREYLVQLFEEPCGHRLTVCRVMLGVDGRWEDGLSWDELQRIKRATGFGDTYAFEIYPRDRDIVNVANMRHLWLLREPLPIGWFASRPNT